MSNQDRLLSDEELNGEMNDMLDDLVAVLPLKTTEIGYEKAGEDIQNTSKKLLDLINTQKRIYAESVRQEAEVSGQLAAVNHLDDKIFYLEVSPRGEFVKRVINKYRDELSKEYAELRAEQRARLR